MKEQYRSISEELLALHETVRAQWPSLSRIAIALYDSESGMVHTFIRSDTVQSELNHYSALLEDVPSLVEIAESGSARVLQDFNQIKHSQTAHSKVVTHYFKSSYTEPLYLGDELLGFVFFDAGEEDYFSNSLILQLRVYSRFVSSLIISEVLPVKTLVGMVNTAKGITHVRDEETGQHLIRMSHYMVEIASALAEKYQFSEEQLEYIHMYAPLHDIGKIAIPDRILLKPTELNKEEFEIIKTHVSEGLEMVKLITTNFGFQNIHHLDLLKEIIGCHHERWNGSGYPRGLSGEQIPIVGRIAAVADVFDALSADRVYRKALGFEEVIKYIETHSGILFDPDCVEAFLMKKDKIFNIYKKFADNQKL